MGSPFWDTRSVRQTGGVGRGSRFRPFEAKVLPRPRPYPNAPEDARGAGSTTVAVRRPFTVPRLDSSLSSPGRSNTNCAAPDASLWFRVPPKATEVSGVAPSVRRLLGRCTSTWRPTPHRGSRPLLRLGTSTGRPHPHGSLAPLPDSGPTRPLLPTVTGGTGPRPEEPQ